VGKPGANLRGAERRSLSWTGSTNFPGARVADRLPLCAAVALVTLLTLTTSGCAGTAVAAWTADELQPGTLISTAHPQSVRDTTSSGHDLTIGSNSTAAISVVAVAGQGSALQFPASGTASLRAAGSSSFNPGTGNFSVRARLSVTAAQVSTTSGSNVIQKGRFGEPQWKLQLDNGIPSCRFADVNGRSIVWRGTHPQRITDGAWFDLTCAKTPGRVALTVQRVGAPTATPETTSVTLGSITNAAPVTVGSKGMCTNADQFRGRLDNITFRRW